MGTIKNIGILDLVYSEADIAKLEAGAALHLRHSNISFKILRNDAPDGSTLSIRVEQGKHLSENYADKERLIKITKDLFSILKGLTVHVHPVPYIPPVVDVVTPKWLSDKMLLTGTRIKDIEANTGIEKTNISPWINGKKPMSQIVKAMFYYYFAFEQQKGRTTFTEGEFNNIRYIISDLEIQNDERLKKMIREQLRNDYGFYISKFSSAKKGFTVIDLLKLVDENVITIIG